jgi:hypothetical protein
MLDDIKEAGGTVRLPLERERFLPLLRRSFAAHGIFISVLAGYCVFLACLFILYPELLVKFAPEGLLGVVLLLSCGSALLLLPYKFIEMAVYERPDRPTLALYRNILSVIGNRDILAKAFPMYLVLCLFMLVFAHVKSSIPVVQPFAWDETFDRWDVAMHFGRRPWEWLHPVLGHPPVTYVLDWNYSLWGLLLIGFWLHYAFLANPGEERTRYLLSFMLSWIAGGSLFALALSSAGPCYYGEGALGLLPDPYAGLMAYLNAANESLPVGALDVQDILWKARDETAPFGGVSAMPSMHNATALLFLLTSRGFPRWLRGLLLVHLILVFLGSVHLAWHYAVDAYVAWAITLAVWYAAGPLSRWWESRPAAQAFRLALDARRRT